MRLYKPIFGSVKKASFNKDGQPCLWETYEEKGKDYSITFYANCDGSKKTACRIPRKSYREATGKIAYIPIKISDLIVKMDYLDHHKEFNIYIYQITGIVGNQVISTVFDTDEDFGYMKLQSAAIEYVSRKDFKPIYIEN